MMKPTTPSRIAVIMAGGAGERFWPLSSPNHPKQFLHLTSATESLIGQTSSLIREVFPDEDIYVATGIGLMDTVRGSGLGIPDDRIITELFRRNTSGCLILTAAEMLARFGEAARDMVMGVFPADHHITDKEGFAITVRAALSVAEHHDALVILGITPSRPETGYGYIRYAGDGEWIEDGVTVHKVLRFSEKPGLETAKEYVTSGVFAWNSGMFFWRLGVFLDELAAASPDMAEAVTMLTDAITSGNHQLLAARFEALPNVSIDYSLMEHSRRVMAVEARFAWDDVGAFDALTRHFAPDAAGNIVSGDPVVLDSMRCLVFSEHPDLDVGVIGCEDMAVIVSEQGVLVMPKDRAQDVKRIVAELKRRRESRK